MIWGRSVLSIRAAKGPVCPETKIVFIFCFFSILQSTFLGETSYRAGRGAAPGKYWPSLSADSQPETLRKARQHAILPAPPKRITGTPSLKKGIYNLVLSAKFTNLAEIIQI